MTLLSYPALSLWQPWASLMADGRKLHETRHWPAPKWLIGKDYVIHAAQKVDREYCEIFGYDWKTIPRGAVISLHRLEECVEFTAANVDAIRDQYGDFEIGRFGWKSPLIRKLANPIPWRGFQSVWNFPPPYPI